MVLVFKLKVLPAHGIIKMMSGEVKKAVEASIMLVRGGRVRDARK